MKIVRKIVFCTFVISTLAIIAFAFWFFSGQPNKEQIAKAFPLKSYQTFTDGKQFTIYSLEPFNETESEETFRDVAVIGKTEIHNKSFQTLLRHAFLNDMSTTMQGAACFNPRHGLRISDGKQTVDLLICFECGNFVSFVSDAKGEGELMGTSEVLFNKTLKDAEIKVSQK